MTLGLQALYNWRARLALSSPSSSRNGPNPAATSASEPLPTLNPPAPTNPRRRPQTSKPSAPNQPKDHTDSDPALTGTSPSFEILGAVSTQRLPVFAP